MLGTILNSICIILGSLIGAGITKHIPTRLLINLPITCGIITIGVGVTLSAKAQHIPAVVIAILIGTILGELLNLENNLERLILLMQKKLHRIKLNTHSNNSEEFLQLYLTLLVLFSASSMGIFGAIQEGASGDINILVAKSILDFFTTIIFAAQLGASIALIAIPQFLIQGFVVLISQHLSPLSNQAIFSDFTASGGIMLLVIGLKICKVNTIPSINMLPTFFIIIPSSLIWIKIFG